MVTKKLSCCLLRKIIHAFLYKQDIKETPGRNRQKIKQNLSKRHPEAEFLLFENHTLSSFMLSKTNMRYSEKCAKNKLVCFNEVVWLIVMKMRLKMKNESHRRNINRTRPRHGCKCTKYDVCLNMKMVICNKQPLRNVWSWTHGKVL